MKKALTFFLILFIIASCNISFGQNVQLTADVQNPLPTDGYRVFQKDVWVEESIVTDWVDADSTGYDPSVIPFNNLHSRITNSTTDNPKTLTINFNESVIMNVIGLGCTGGDDFSNVKIEAINSGGIATTVYDNSSDNTKYTSQTLQLPATFGANAMRFTFHTTDEICISNIYIPKTTGVVARIQATKPDGTVTDINATQGGNLKTSLEEFESDISSNNNTQLNMTAFHADGTEGNLITGVKYVLGKSGIDSVTESQQSISQEHHEIHEGNHYNISDYELGVAVSATIELVVTTPNTTKWGHLTFSTYSSLGATIELFEGSTDIVAGTSIIPRNNNRNSINTSDFVVVKDPTSITDGTRAAGFLAGAGRTSGFVDRDKENVLGQNEIYLVRITSLANSNNISWNFEWYEHINKN